MSIAKANFLEPYSPSFGGWGRLRDKIYRSSREQNTSGPEALATEIVRSNPNVIWVVGPGAVIFKKLTSRIPIVAITGDPVKQGIADSLAHRGAISRELASTPVKPFMDDASKRCLACSSSTHPKRIVWPVIDAFVGTGRTAMILNTEMRDVRQRCLPMPGTVARGAGTVLGDPASPKSIRTALSRTSCLNGASGPGCSLAQASRPVYRGDPQAVIGERARAASASGARGRFRRDA
jgi:hypothetical protein